MTIEMAIDLLRQLILTALMLCTPIMLTAICVGLTVSLIQSVTSIQEQTLTFVPKLFAVAFMVIISSHWLIRTVMEFSIGFFQRIPDMAP